MWKRYNLYGIGRSLSFWVVVYDFFHGSHIWVLYTVPRLVYVICLPEMVICCIIPTLFRVYNCGCLLSNKAEQVL